MNASILVVTTTLAVLFLFFVTKKPISSRKSAFFKVSEQRPCFDTFFVLLFNFRKYLFSVVRRSPDGKNLDN